MSCLCHSGAYVEFSYICIGACCAVIVTKVENIVLEIPFPKSVLNVTLTTTQGKYSFDPVTKVMTWDVGKMDSSKLPNIRGSVCQPVIVFVRELAYT